MAKFSYGWLPFQLHHKIGGKRKEKNTLRHYNHENRKMKRNYYELWGKKKSIKENRGRDQSYENEKWLYNFEEFF